MASCHGVVTWVVASAPTWRAVAEHGVRVEVCIFVFSEDREVLSSNHVWGTGGCSVMERRV